MKETNKKTQMSPPWYGYYRKINALFGKDPAIKLDFDETELAIIMRVEERKKQKQLRNCFRQKYHMAHSKLRSWLSRPTQKSRTVRSYIRKRLKEIRSSHAPKQLLVCIQILLLMLCLSLRLRSFLMTTLAIYTEMLQCSIRTLPKRSSESKEFIFVQTLLRNNND